MTFRALGLSFLGVVLVGCGGGGGSVFDPDASPDGSVVDDSGINFPPSDGGEGGLDRKSVV